MKQEINGGNLGPDEFHMGRVSAFVHAANSEVPLHPLACQNMETNIVAAAHCQSTSSA